ncbi:hypothetical protein YOLOSWAG_192 [Erwinia phage vB_EamM_Yoloswag]|uniref:Uncharacterized protein n=1 Tax=Erwinia phage vB_EamM_Yoloswag TaxID=1958956 RepID=A0A1S6L3A3_9CAUD|nr:hypothetical protein HOR66_gp192 [Erwinia phage vB_EamM_Yoloswag]AQT28671.1 hypothetical protein YOLOSWAG_192 [Erwinia phage vB_EamM_Yoloswag]
MLNYKNYDEIFQNLFKYHNYRIVEDSRMTAVVRVPRRRSFVERLVTWNFEPVEMEERIQHSCQVRIASDTIYAHPVVAKAIRERIIDRVWGKSKDDSTPCL